MPFACSYVINGDHFGFFVGVGWVKVRIKVRLGVLLAKKYRTVERRVLVQL